MHKLGIKLWTEIYPVSSENKTSQKNSNISTGSYFLDHALGTGGWPTGKIIEIYGADSSGKSTLALHAVAEAQSMGKTCVYIDLENTLNFHWASKIGVKIDQLYISYPTSGEKTFEIINSLIRENETDLIIVDSVASMVPEAELSSSLSDQSMGLQSRLMSKGLRILQALLINSKTTIIFINQVREQIKQQFFPTTTTPGGRALKHAASIRIETKKQEMMKQNEKIIGVIIKTTIMKNKFNQPMISIPLRLTFDFGFDKIYELIFKSLELNLLTKKGTWYYYKEKNLGQNIQSIRQHLVDENNKKILNSLKESIFSK